MVFRTANNMRGGGRRVPVANHAFIRNWWSLLLFCQSENCPDYGPETTSDYEA